MSEANLHDNATGETLAILQEEITRLEAELRWRDEELERADREESRVPETSHPGAQENALRERVEKLTSELAGRDETIEVLLEQTQFFEEAAAAARAEWDQLTGWVEEVERRVETQNERDSRIGDELEAERRRGDDLRGRLASEGRSWEARRRGLEAEVSDLRGRLDVSADSGPDRVAAAGALERENGRLRDRCNVLEIDAVTAAEVGPLREQLAATAAELRTARDDLERRQDEQARERKEHEAALVDLKSQSAREALLRAAPARNPALEADDRIRALRDHLQDLQREEMEQKAARKLSARLSRLWRHTGPS